MGEVIVNVEQGKLKGKTGTDFAGKTFYSFQGIPFAKPPLGNLRFKDPQPPEKWEGIRDATKEGSICFQRNMRTGALEGGEDCLFLNVYTPQIDKKKDTTLKPVMFWIHGGAFTAGSGNTDIYGPEYLIANDVVLVTTNYRLGLLGFFKLDDPSLEVPGNAALKDLVLSLRWVKSNIENFLGDPNNVTIFGESAGSAAVHYLVLSPLSKGLFHKAIMQSGSAASQWASGSHNDEMYSKVLNLNTTDEREIYKTLQELPVEKLFEIQEKLDQATPGGAKKYYGTVAERPSNKAFLTSTPKEILQSGNYNKVPLLVGYTDAEGILSILLAMKSGVDPVHKDFEILIPLAFNLEKGGAKSKQVAQKIKEFYYGDKEPSKETLEAFVKLESDVHFVHAIQKTVKNAAEKTQEPVYLYRFAFDGQIYLLPRIIPIPFKGAAHADELSYLFKTQLGFDIKPGSTVEATVKRMTKLWTNFAKYGNPNPREKDEVLNVEWQPVNRDELKYLNIDEELSSGVNPEAERMAFWDELYEDYPEAKFW